MVGRAEVADHCREEVADHCREEVADHAGRRSLTTLSEKANS